MRGFGPQAVTYPGPSGLARPPVGRRVFADGYRLRARKVRFRIKPRSAASAAVHHDFDAFDGQAGFGNGGGQHHFAFARRVGHNGPVLFLLGQLAVQRMDGKIGEQFVQALGAFAYFGFAGQKHQRVAVVFVYGFAYRGGYAVRKVHEIGGRIGVVYAYRVLAAFALYGGSVEHAGEFGHVEGGGHDEYAANRVAGPVGPRGKGPGPNRRGCCVRGIRQK